MAFARSPPEADAPLLPSPPPNTPLPPLQPTPTLTQWELMMQKADSAAPVGAIGAPPGAEHGDAEENKHADGAAAAAAPAPGVRSALWSVRSYIMEISIDIFSESYLSVG